ncbi:dual specificity calcium/calmodulin-dependent 3',5'-cyclic nucleotide phosphodiesterase 1C-like [Lampetra fluviatilis]
MTDKGAKKGEFMKRRSATFNIGGCSYIIVAKEHYDAEGRRPLERFRRTQSHSSIRGPSAQQEKGATQQQQQHLLVPGGGEWGPAGGDRGHGGGRADDRDPAQVLAEEPPPCDSPEALERAAVR